MDISELLFLLYITLLSSLLLGLILLEIILLSCVLGYVFAYRSSIWGIRIFTFLITCGMRFSPFYAARAWAYLKRKDYPKVIDDCNRVLSFSPILLRSTLAYSYRGIALVQLGNYEEALMDLNCALQNKKNNALLYANRGIAEYHLRQFEQAAIDFSSALQLKLNPHTIWAWHFLRGAAYIHLKRYQEAIDDFSTVLEYKPENLQAYRQRGQLYIYLRQYEQAKEDFIRVLELDSEERCQDWYGRAFASFQFKDYDIALEEISRLLKLDAQFSAAYILRGCCWIKKKDYQQAITDFEHALIIDPYSYYAYYNRAYVYLVLDRLESAWADLMKAHELQPQWLETVWLLERWQCCQQLLPDQGQAERLSALITLDTEHTFQHLSPLVLLCRAVALWITADYEQALTPLQEVLKLEPEEADGFFWLGMVLSALGREKEASEAFEQARFFDLPPFFWKTFELVQPTLVVL